VNISTMAAIVTAAAGVPVVKHGARAATSKAGARTCWSVGVASTCRRTAVLACVTELGIAFCFAPLYTGVSARVRAAAETGVADGVQLPRSADHPAQPAVGWSGVPTRRWRR